jgi:hypothetical protein
MMENKDALPNAVNPVKFIIMSMRHIAPPVLYSTSPLTYLASGAANLFYEGEGESRNDGCDDPSVIIYWIIESIRDHDDSPPSLAINEPSHEECEEDKYGCRLIGYIPCSDAFGVDLILDKYNKSIGDLKKK